LLGKEINRHRKLITEFTASTATSRGRCLAPKLHYIKGITNTPLTCDVVFWFLQIYTQEEQKFKNNKEEEERLL